MLDQCARNSRDEHANTSIDGSGYRILTFSAVPVTAELVFSDSPEEDVLGAGGPAICLISAAVCNDIFDATSARSRSVPFTPERLLAALGTEGS